MTDLIYIFPFIFNIVKKKEDLNYPEKNQFVPNYLNSFYKNFSITFIRNNKKIYISICACFIILKSANSLDPENAQNMFL